MCSTLYLEKANLGFPNQLLMLAQGHALMEGGNRHVVPKHGRKMATNT